MTKLVQVGNTIDQGNFDSNPRIAGPTEAFTDLPTSLQFQLASLQDHFCRDLGFPIHTEPHSSVVETMAFVDRSGCPIGWTRFWQRRPLLVRAADSYAEAFEVAALSDFPITERCDKETWGFMIKYVCTRAAELGNAVTMCIPPEAEISKALLETAGFRFIGTCHNRPQLAELGYKEPCCVFVRDSNTTEAFSALPWLFKTNIRSCADAATAPKPSLDFWEKARLYSSYSAYPNVPMFLQQVVARSVHSILSAPCAGGDILRFLEPSKAYRRVGIDICPHAVRLAESRIRYPLLDELNAHLLSALRSHRLGLMDETSIFQLAEDLLLNLNNQKPSADQIRSLGSDFVAAFDRAIESPAVSDWFVLTKILAIHLEPDTEPSPEKLIEILTRRYSTIEYFLSSTCHAAIFPDLPSACSTSVIQGDVLNLDNFREEFDLVLVWEALLMFNSIGREKEFLHFVAKHVSIGGCVILTGLRSTFNHIPHELTIAAKILDDCGFDCRVFSLQIPHSPWFIQIDPLIIPVLCGERR